MHDLPTAPRTPLEQRRRRWFVALLLLAMAGLLFHPLIHHQPDAQCAVCILGAGASPLPSNSLAQAIPFPFFVAIVLPFATARAPAAPTWRTPPGRAPPALSF